MKFKNYIFASVLTLLIFNLLSGKFMKTNGTSTLTVSSQSFINGQKIPAKHGYKNKNISPQLSWSSGPIGTQSYAIICDDPDAPTPSPWVHWIVFNIPASTTSLPENVSNVQQATNSYGQINWGGPNPPSGTHRYFFKVYALDTMLPNLTNPTKEQLLAAMNKGNILAQGEIMGTYAASK